MFFHFIDHSLIFIHPHTHVSTYSFIYPSIHPPIYPSIQIAFCHLSSVGSPIGYIHSWVQHQKFAVPCEVKLLLLFMMSSSISVSVLSTINLRHLLLDFVSFLWAGRCWLHKANNSVCFIQHAQVLTVYKSIRAPKANILGSHYNKKKRPTRQKCRIKGKRKKRRCRQAMEKQI